MARTADQDRIEAVARYLGSHPGSKPVDVARGLGLPPSSVTRLLPSLQDNGYLLSEDDKGGLWPFDEHF